MNSDTWQTATLLKSEMIGDNVKSLVFSLPAWTPHIPGQHFDIRLTAPDGYQAQRSYSIASLPQEKGIVEFGIELLPDGEVSPYLFQLKSGGQVDIRGPLGGHFIWDHTMPGPLVLVAGGSGVVPFMSMLRYHFANPDTRPVHLVYSAKTESDILYYSELKNYALKHPDFNLTLTLTRASPPDWSGFTGRIGKGMLKKVLGSLILQMPMVYVCGSTPFVEDTATNLVSLGFHSHTIRTERFGG